ncbi:MAG: GntR family transcriptional regulator, partial [Proteobacteria bacterium]|nr:GntR family transcriptional regulator [Pseudomonadota bacterium]
MATAARSPRYLDVADTLQNEISALAPNSLLPTEEQLARRFGVSRVTVRGALDLLEKSGLVSRLRGRGTTVSPPKITRRFAPLYSFERDLSEQGIAFDTRLLSFDPKAIPPLFIRERLHLAAKSTAGSLSLVRVVDDRVVCHDQRFYPPEISGRIEPTLVESEDASRVLENVVGAPIVEVDWESEIISASGAVAAALGVASRTL